MQIPKQWSSLLRSDGSKIEISTSKWNGKYYWRLFPNQAIPLLGHFANTPTKVLLCLIQNARTDNTVHLTYDEIMQTCNIKDRSSISATLKELKELHAIVTISESTYMINPSILCNGNNQKFGFLATQFNTYLENQLNMKGKK